MKLRSSRVVEKQRQSRSFEEEFQVAVESLELIDKLEEYLVMPEDWFTARKHRLRTVSEHFGPAFFPVLRVAQGVYPVPIELVADVLTACYDDFAYLDKLYHFYAEDEKIDEPKTEAEQVDREMYKRVVLFRFLMYDYLCVLNFGKPYKKLVADAVNGSEEALVEVLQVDKTFVTTRWCSERIRERQYAGEWEYFEKIGKAIAKRPVRKDQYMFKAVLLVARFWDERFRKMSYAAIVKFLVERDVLPKTGHRDVEPFRKLLNRAGLKKERYNRKSRTEEDMRMA